MHLKTACRCVEDGTAPLKAMIFNLIRPYITGRTVSICHRRFAADFLNCDQFVIFTIYNQCAALRHFITDSALCGKYAVAVSQCFQVTAADIGDHAGLRDSDPAELFHLQVSDVLLQEPYVLLRAADGRLPA